MQNRTFLVLLRLIFCEKLKIAPLKRLNFRIWPKNQSQFRWRPFFFFFVWRPPDFGRKKRLNFGFRPKNQSQFRLRPFFFLETTWFWAEKTFEFPRNFVSIFGQTVWNWFKNNENSGQGCLHFSHSFKIAPPPLFQILATRLGIWLIMEDAFEIWFLHTGTLLWWSSLEYCFKVDIESCLLL